MHFQVPPRRTPSLKQTQQSWEPPETPRTVMLRDDAPSSPRTVISDGKPDTNGTKLYEDEASSFNDDYDGMGAGIARTTDDRNGHITSQRDDHPSDSELSDARVDMRDLDTALPALPPDVHKQQRNAAPSVASRRSEMSQGGITTNSGGGSSGSGPTRMPEFFSHGVFQTVLHNPTISHQLLKFGQSRLCGENLEFLARVNRYHTLIEEVAKAVSEIHKDFISNSAPAQINLPESVLFKVNNEMRYALSSALPMMESIFTHAQADIEKLVYTDIYPKFVRHQMSVSAAKALGTDKNRYAGLGDCFVLTDPSKADNPLVYVSDGFVKVSGYSRNEIIPRNCRFLQSRHTDRAAVRRLKAAIEKREPIVELLLNIRKDGEPFWNLLYTTPLFDGHGNLVFFLGGQINCSTTIHSGADVLRILAQSKDSEESATPGVASPQQQYAKPPRRSILSAFRTTSRSNIQQGSPGMENKLLNKLEDMPLRNQMSTFYTAYSNVSLLF